MPAIAANIVFCLYNSRNVANYAFMINYDKVKKLRALFPYLTAISICCVFPRNMFLIGFRADFCSI